MLSEKPKCKTVLLHDADFVKLNIQRYTNTQRLRRMYIKLLTVGISREMTHVLICVTFFFP